MEQAKEIKSFFYGQYFSEGIRISLGCMVPVLVCAAIGQFYVGTLISFGALLIGLSDSPGPASHRRTGMLACLALCVATFFVTILAHSSIWFMFAVIGILSFTYSMFGVFSSRASTVGAMAMLMMLTNVDDRYSFEEELQFLLLFLIGAVWYMVVSFSFTKIRPYRLAQQELAESIRHVGDFLRLKSNFYNTKTDYDQNYLKLIEKQVVVHEHQEKVRDLLLRSKRSIKDTTRIGRFLTLVFNDIVDIFEQSMSTFYDYAAIRKKFADTGALHHFRFVLIKLTHELDHFAYQLTINKMPVPLYDFTKDIENLKAKVEQIDSAHPELNTLPLKKIIVNIRRIAALISNMYGYSRINTAEIKKQEIDEADKFIQTSHIDWKVFRNNLSLSSSIFRHSLRMGIVMAFSFLLVQFANFSNHGTFWVLLTILVILKPGFGLTKERNFQRLIGTVIGGILGGIILITVHHPIVLFGFLILFFLIAYSLFRINYIMFVVFLTPYALIMISFTGVNTLTVVQERILDTLIGCAIAFLSSYIIFPNWESSQIKTTVSKLLLANYHFFEQIAKILANIPVDVTEYKLARKEVYIASANMGSAFQRLLTEPKWQQKNTKEINRFVVLNHLFSSYASSLYSGLDNAESYQLTPEQFATLKRIAQNLYKILLHLDIEDLPEDWTKNYVTPTDTPENTTDSDLITERLQFLLKISADLQKATDEVIRKDELKSTNETAISNG